MAAGEPESQPHGALRAGPSLAALAMAYDLNYDGWEDGFRQRVAAEVAGDHEGPHMSLEDVVRGRRHNPRSNHWGMQVGGGALALLAVMGDPGVDQQQIERLLPESERAMIRNMTEGFGSGGYFAEGDGTGSMASFIVFLPALQAWKTAAGRDFITPRPHAQWMSLRWILLTVPRGDDLAAPCGTGMRDGTITSCEAPMPRRSGARSRAGRECRLLPSHQEERQPTIGSAAHGAASFNSSEAGAKGDEQWLVSEWDRASCWRHCWRPRMRGTMRDREGMCPMCLRMMQRRQHEGENRDDRPHHEH